MTTPEFPDLLALIDDRSRAFAAAAGATPDDVRVPGCPDWTVRDLVGHLGGVQRFWAEVVAAGPATRPPVGYDPATPPADLSGWIAESTEMMIAALQKAGRDRGAWAWWASEQRPTTTGAVARHQVQEAAVHAHDAQEAAGNVEPLPSAVAADGVPEFLAICYGACGAWPHRPARVTWRPDTGEVWNLDLDAGGAATAPGGAGGPEPDATVDGTASDIVLALYGRRPLDVLEIDGDRDLLRRLLAWPPFG